MSKMHHDLESPLSDGGWSHPRQLRDVDREFIPGEQYDVPSFLAAIDTLIANWTGYDGHKVAFYLSWKTAALSFQKQQIRSDAELKIRIDSDTTGVLCLVFNASLPSETGSNTSNQLLIK
jgi:hypothetical protein